MRYKLNIWENVKQIRKAYKTTISWKTTSFNVRKGEMDYKEKKKRRPLIRTWSIKGTLSWEKIRKGNFQLKYENEKTERETKCNTTVMKKRHYEKRTVLNIVNKEEEMI